MKIRQGFYLPKKKVVAEELTKGLFPAED